MSSALEAQRLNHWTPRDVSSPGHSEEGKICDMVANQYLCLCAKLRVNRSSFYREDQDIDDDGSNNDNNHTLLPW